MQKEVKVLNPTLTNNGRMGCDLYWIRETAPREDTGKTVFQWGDA
jgi:hypothetical protein